jgi:hypothetical protein
MESAEEQLEEIHSRRGDIEIVVQHFDTILDPETDERHDIPIPLENLEQTADWVEQDGSRTRVWMPS